MNITGVDSGLKNRSLFNPPNTANQHVEVFKNLILKALDQVMLRKNTNPPYFEEGITLLYVQQTRAVGVMLDKNYCDTQLEQMLSEENTYVRLKNDPTNTYHADLRRLVDLGRDRKVLNKKNICF